MKALKNIPVLFIIPLLFVGWGFVAVVAFDPFYSRSIDPEFPYLINGLTVALNESSDIGHTDHPGTPFQVFMGLGIRLLHAISGRDSLTYDVLSRHQHYHAGISLMLTILTSLVLLAIGIVGNRRGIRIHHLIILQAGFLFSDLIMWHYVRMVPERFMMITSLLFILTYLAYGHENRHATRFAVLSGLIMGMGLATKFNYLPLLIIPLFVLATNKTRLIYIASIAASFIVGILPVIRHFADFRHFITNLARHDGLYGSGEARMFNPEKMLQGMREIMYYTPELVIWLALIVLVIAWAYFGKKTKNSRHTAALFIGFLAAAVLQTLIVAKHFKAGYQLPFHTMLGFVMFSVSLFVAGTRIPKRIQQISVITACLLLSGINIWRMVRDTQHISQQQSLRLEMARFVDEKMPEQPAWFVEPAWLSGPHQENAIIFGLSYARGREKYLPELKRINPHVITYEGNPDVVKFWRGETANLDSIVATGTMLYLYQHPGLNAYLLMDMLNQSAERQGLIMLSDTIFSQPETNAYILAARALPDF